MSPSFESIYFSLLIFVVFFSLLNFVVVFSLLIFVDFVVVGLGLICARVLPF